MLAILIILAVACGSACAWVSAQKGREPVAWFVGGLLLGPLAVVLAVLNPGTKQIPKETGLVIAGSTLLAWGAWLFFWSAPAMDNVRSAMGKAAIAVSDFAGNSDVGTQVLVIRMEYYGGIVLMIVGAVLLLPGLLGLVMK